MIVFLLSYQDISIFFFFSYTDGICDKKTRLVSLTETYNDTESLTQTKAKIQYPWTCHVYCFMITLVVVKVLSSRKKTVSWSVEQSHIYLHCQANICLIVLFLVFISNVNYNILWPYLCLKIFTISLLYNPIKEKLNWLFAKSLT